MLRTLWILALVIVTDALLPQSADAQAVDRLPLAEERFFERFEGGARAPASGSLLVGVWLGRESDRFAPSDIGVILPPDLPAERVCLGVVSRDGRYFAENLYSTTAVRGGWTGFDFRSQYLDAISRYPRSHVATLIRSVGRCHGEDAGVILPSVAPEEERATTLWLALNAPSERTTAALLRSDSSLVAEASACRSDPDLVSTAFATICSVDLPEGLASGSYALRVTVQERFRHVMRIFDLILHRS